MKVNNKEELEDIIEMLEENMTTLNRNLILQEYI
jgi:glutathione synthase/RimK-type ligase-like ATP-grasp enzyme